MSEPKLISPMLDQFAMGDPISDHNGVRCCPAMRNDTDDRYIVKIISVPASQTQLEALLLTGAYPDTESALAYFKTLADETVAEVNTLQKLSEIEGFVAFEDIQVVPMEDEAGFDIYLLSPYRRTLTKHFVRSPMTQLSAINLGLDLCAALAVCRRSGYLCVDLKPNNIFVTPEQEFKIGDIGFVRLDSLKYASLPDKYRSAYTAPEIADAFSSLNDRIDVYALGLILYQAYNNGELPFTGTTPPDEAFAPPMFADYEMSEIILKACAPNPEDRWQDPIQMGQALVGYMQRNGANDTPIVPPTPVIEEIEAEEEPDQPEVEAIEADAVETDTLSQPEETVAEEESVYHEDPEGNLSFLESLEFDESELEQSGEEISYEVLSDEATQILAQADELAELSVPDPVVAPEPVEITVPDPVLPEEDISEEINEEPTEETSEELLEEEASASEEVEDDTAEAPETKKKQSGRWLRIFIPVVLLLTLLAGGVYYYINYYLQPIESVVVSGSEDSLTVFVTSVIDESKLTVICSDAYGNQIPAPVSNGKAVFTNLIPDTGYNIYVQIEGFHKLTGQTSASYSTPVQTSIVQFSAVTGSEDGSVILSFTVDGKDAENWTVIYSADDEEEQTATFSAHTVTLTGLTVGKEYTFTLIADDDLYLTGIEQITYTASELVFAENLMVTGCVNNTLTATWSAPADKTIESWTVRCYNDNYNKTIITPETTAVFENLNHTESFTVEVIAAGMSVSQRFYVPENSVTVTDLKADSADCTGISLSWNTSTDIPQNGWVLQYQIEGSDIKGSIACTKNNARIAPVIPGCTYNFSLQDTSGDALLGGVIRCVVPEAVDFTGTYSSQRVTRSNLNFNMCYALDWANGRYSNAEHSTKFSVGQKACFIVRLGTSATSRRDNSATTISYVIRDASGKPVSVSGETLPWTQMWNGSGYCKLDLPNMPDTAGSYTISIYFNGALAHEQDFTVTV
ncbi:MAG: protein kinase [Oscillospiraceae bacterium]|nr:protein kinase [Oscillospiraceae bacterium]